MILWLSQSIHKRKSSSQSVCDLHCSKYISSRQRETRNISVNAGYIVHFKSPRNKQQISVLAQQVNPGQVHEFMKSYEEATKRPHCYLMLDLIDDQHRLKSNVLPKENIAKQQNLDH